ncbi:lysophospholipid acyltransferase family protein [Anaerosinus massiliensis]|uniref:lysophospholipid acyltransferase family protein n=1 Tax=Massilibacillus massiliensis TaxID=1806837 RepID=UPI000AB3A47A|nr:lysophospholipid acyltransferase family protein [Massilibacillus massiliensis]
MQYRVLKFISWVLCLLPHRVLLWLGKILGGIYYQIAAKQRKRAIKQMMESLQVSEEKAKKICLDSFINIGRTFLEIMYMPNLKRHNFTEYMEIEHMDRFKNALAEGHGVVILTAHIGNWEWLSAALTFSDIPLTAIIKRQPNDQHTVLLNEYREMVGVEVFSRGTTELVGAAKALKKGKTLGFLADQDAGPSGAFIDFLGKPASTPLGPAVFAKRFKSPVIPCFIVRKPDGKHKVIIHEPLYYQDHGNEEQDLYDFTVKMTRILETTIREHPTQWLWFQKRWNTTPDMKKQKQRHTTKEQVEHE